MRIEALEWLKGDKDRSIYGAGYDVETLGKAQTDVSLIQAIYDAGAVRVEVEIDEVESESTATIYVTIDPQNITKRLLTLFGEFQPDEFWELEDEPNVFRLWRD